MRHTLCAVALIAATAAGQQLVVPKPDLRVAIPVAPLTAAVHKLDGVAFAGEWQTGTGHNCATQVQLQNPSFQADSWARYTDGAGGFAGGLTSTVKAFTDDSSPPCFKASVPATIAATTCTDAIERTITVRGSVSIFGLAIGLEFPIPNPFIIQTAIPFHLDKIPPTSNMTMQLEFGDFVNNKWLQSDTPQDRLVPLNAILRGLGGAMDTTSQSLCDGAKSESLSIRRNATYLAADISLARAATTNAASLPDANKLLDTITGTTNGITLSISPRFIGDGNPGVGLFGSILPMRLSGTYEYQKGKQLNFAIALLSARAEFRNVDGAPAILIGFQLTPLRVWTIANGIEANLTPKHLIATMVVDPPLINGDGIVTIHVREFAVGFQTRIGAARVCVNAEQLEQAMNKNPVVVGIVPSLQIGLPDCIPVDSFNAARPCADGISKDRLSNDHPDRNSVIHIDVRHPLPATISNGRLSFVVPISSK